MVLSSLLPPWLKMDKLGACVGALCYALILNRSEFSMPGCLFLPWCFEDNCLLDVPGHQKAFPLPLEMNVMKFITLGIAPEAKSCLSLGCQTNPWSGALIRMGLFAVMVFTITGEHEWFAPFRDLRKLHSCQIRFSFLGIPRISVIFSPPSSVFSSLFLQLKASVPSGLPVQLQLSFFPLYFCSSVNTITVSLSLFTVL